MSKTIRLELPIYDRLDTFRGKHETFSHAVDRLLDIRDGIVSLTSTLQGGQAFAEYQSKKLREATPIVAGADSTKVPNL